MMLFDPPIVTVKQLSIVSQIVSSPVILSWLVLLDLVNKSFVRRWQVLATIIPSTDVIQLTLTLKMTTAQVVETSVTVKSVNNNSPIQVYVHPDDQTQPTFEIALTESPIYKKLQTSAITRDISDSNLETGRSVSKSGVSRIIQESWQHCMDSAWHLTFWPWILGITSLGRNVGRLPFSIILYLKMLERFVDTRSARFSME